MLITLGGKLLVRGGKLATSLDCCCNGGCDDCSMCPADLSLAPLDLADYDFNWFDSEGDHVTTMRWSVFNGAAHPAHRGSDACLWDWAAVWADSYYPPEYGPGFDFQLWARVVCMAPKRFVIEANTVVLYAGNPQYGYYTSSPIDAVDGCVPPAKYPMNLVSCGSPFYPTHPYCGALSFLIS